jgi:hypothetical protein
MITAVAAAGLISAVSVAATWAGGGGRDWTSGAGAGVAFEKVVAGIPLVKGGGAESWKHGLIFLFCP